MKGFVHGCLVSQFSPIVRVPRAVVGYEEPAAREGWWRLENGRRIVAGRGNLGWRASFKERPAASYLCNQECPLLAQSGHWLLHCACPLSKAKRTSRVVQFEY